jgi:S1-C subfamily serine protease
VSERFDPDFGLRGDSRKDKGTRVVQVLPGSDAETMGLKAGDKLLEIDGADSVVIKEFDE